MIFQGSARYPVDEIVIHCAATHPDWMRGQPLAAKRKEIDRWHREERGWRKIGYHHLIDHDGAILPGRAETEIGAGVEGHNRGVIQICLIGGAGAAATDAFDRNFTTAVNRHAKLTPDRHPILPPVSARSGPEPTERSGCG
ncbi:MAG: N-acetylmuramoyl-L-alanine amidase, partial [Rhodobacterales bacterium]|nr:N-acetylmuramoyl-L-alanine amidase [Rhodobacterales bacterium]